MKSKVSIILVLVLVFSGGFLSGMLVFNPTANDDPSKFSSVGQLPLSEKNPKEKQQTDIQLPESKVLIGYVQDYRNPEQLDMTHLTHVIFSFAHPGKDGSLLMNGENAINNLRSTVKKAHEQNKKVLLAVGGWYHIHGGESYDYFTTALENPTSRKKLVNELIAIIDRENLDGIDIDYEHPRSQKDAKNLAILINELSEQLKPQHKLLSIAVNAKVHSVAGTEITSVVYEPSMFNDVDYVNIMAYDGQWDGGYNAENLSPYSYTENIINYWTNLFDTNQLTKEKLVLGVPFYAQPEDPNSKQISFAAIVNHDSSSATNDTIKMNGTTYHYNGTKTMERKTALALDHGLGGMMLWEAGHDAAGPHNLTATISTKLQSESKSTESFAR